MIIVLMVSVSLVVAVTFPGVAGGLTWLATLGVTLLAVGLRYLPFAALERMRWLLAAVGLAMLSLLWTPSFMEGLQAMAQVFLLPLCYVVGWRLHSTDVNSVRVLSSVALFTMPLALAVFARSWVDGSFRFGWLVGNAARPMVIAMALLFIIGTIDRSRRVALAAGGFALLVAFASGGRMGFAVIALLMVISPAVGLRWRTRLALAGVGLLALTFVVQTDAFQDRFFLGREPGTLSDILLLRGNFNTAGRADNWPGIIEACSTSPMLGTGIGSTSRVTLIATNGVTDHPHNEFIRTYCDIGLVGSAFYWMFFVSAGWRGFRAWWRRQPIGLGAAGFQVVVALIAFSVTDNPTVYTSAFMAPALLVLGMADSGSAVRRDQLIRDKAKSPSEIA